MGDDSKNANNNMLVDIYREVGETKVVVKGVSKKLDEHVDYSLREFKAINELDAEQNKILDAHVQGVNTLKNMHVAHREETKKQIDILKESLNVQRTECGARLEALEKPYDIVKLLGKVLIWSIPVIIAVLGLLFKAGVL